MTTNDTADERSNVSGAGYTRRDRKTDLAPWIEDAQQVDADVPDRPEADVADEFAAGFEVGLGDGVALKSLAKPLKVVDVLDPFDDAIREDQHARRERYIFARGALGGHYCVWLTEDRYGVPAMCGSGHYTTGYGTDIEVYRVKTPEGNAHPDGTSGDVVIAAGSKYAVETGALDDDTRVLYHMQGEDYVEFEVDR